MAEWLIQLKQNQTLIPNQTRYLLNGSTKHFKSGPLRSVTAWVRRIESELEKKQLSSNLPDIRNWLKPIIPKKSKIKSNKPCDTFEDASSTSNSTYADTITMFELYQYE